MSQFTRRPFPAAGNCRNSKNPFSPPISPSCFSGVSCGARKSLFGDARAPSLSCPRARAPARAHRPAAALRRGGCCRDGSARRRAARAAPRRRARARALARLRAPPRARARLLARALGCSCSRSRSLSRSRCCRQLARIGARDAGAPKGRWAPASDMPTPPLERACARGRSSAAQSARRSVPLAPAPRGLRTI